MKPIVDVSLREEYRVARKIAHTFLISPRISQSSYNRWRDKAQSLHIQITNIIKDRFKNE